jgi:hypothetical protein
MKTLILTVKNDTEYGKYIIVEAYKTPNQSIVIGRVYPCEFSPDGIIKYIDGDTLKRIADICDNFSFYFDNIKAE